MSGGDFISGVRLPSASCPPLLSSLPPLIACSALSHSEICPATDCAPRPCRAQCVQGIQVASKDGGGRASAAAGGRDGAAWPQRSPCALRTACSLHITLRKKRLLIHGGLDAQPHRAVEAPAGLKACFEPLFSTSSPALSRGHYDSLSTPRLDKFCEPMGWPPAQPSFSGAPSPTVRRDRESTKSPLLLAAARTMQFRSPRACCRRGAKVSCSAGGCLSHGVMMQRVCC